MLLRFCALAVSAFLLAAPACAADEAPITQVTLYPGSATITRTAQITPGMRLLQVYGLPANFDTKTLQAKADPGIRIGQIVVQEASGKESEHPQVKTLKKQILAQKDRIAALDIEVKSAELVTGYLGRMESGEKTDAKSLQGIVSGIETAAQQALHRAQQAEIKKRTFAEELARLEFELAQLQSGTKNARSISVHLAAERAGQISLSYQVNRAGWQPSYRAALDSAKNSVDLERLAQVSQKTGEDWTDVKLRLSTGQPQAFREAVDPQTRRLVYRKPEARDSMQPVGRMPMAAPARAMSVEKRVKGGDDDDYVAPVIETQGAFATEFEVPGRVTLPADGREVAVSLGKQVQPASLRVQVTPGADRAGILIAEFERAPGVWLTGNIQLVRDGSYVGATRWNPASSEKFSLGFGQDELLRVNVERKELKDGSAGFVGQRQQRKVADTYTLSSLHRQEIEVLVLEAAPVAQSEEIEVERSFQPAPSGEDWKGRPGVMYWSKKLAPKENWKIDIGYTISYPKEGSVSGLP